MVNKTRKIKQNIDQTNNPTNGTGFSVEKLKYILEYISAIIVVLTLGFGAGCFYQETKDNILLLHKDVEHEKEIRELENQIQELRLMEKQRSDQDMNKIIEIINENIKQNEKK